MNLFTPFTLGSIQCQNRIGMAAMSRQRCDNKEMIPTSMMKQYYMQRCTAGFIITEGLPLSLDSIAQDGSSAIFNIKQADAWAQIVQELHTKGCKIIAQLWHCGRVTNQINNPLAPSAIKIKNSKYNQPKEMSIDDIQQVIKQYLECSKLIQYAGFDGIEIQASSGYLLDSFLKSSSNKRKDNYGGSVENRCRIILEIIDQLQTVFEPQKLGVKISPITRQYDSYDPNPKELYKYLLEQLNVRNIGFIEIRDDDYPENWLDFGYPSSKSDIANVFEFCRPLFKGCIIGNGKVTPEIGDELIKKHFCDAISFGRLFTSNPDLVDKIKNGDKLNEVDNSTLLSQGPKGYIY
ncbi:unnamed protein product [Paramecium pentaurelia]|uniref:NADH:flavin oxidoreductase/NADH oxidase N-terminal domain-containing protein n=1 Tax=Paramecium pentaurelia TaxID=43138 RepID=A0A8S1TUZ1_9CILI|nr:unnamed protein product [Paramecium pentaurelia]